MPLGKRITQSCSSLPDQPQIDQTEKKVHSVKSDSQDKIPAQPEFTLFQSEGPRYCFDDIVLNSSVYDSIQDVLALYNKRDLLFNQWGLGKTQKSQNRAGINLYGYSGTGKSMAAHAIAKQLDRKILTVDYSQIESKYVGETSKNLVSMFSYAKETRSVIFFDEADALLSKRVTNMSNSTDVSVNQTRSVLLMLINDYDDLILFASNFISNYDPAFMRRILAHVKFELPDEAARLRLWRMYIPEQLPTNADINTLAEKNDGISGADISNAVLNAALRTARLNGTIVDHAYFEEAIERVKKSKADNNDLGELTSKRTVSEEYVKSQFGGELPS